MALTLRIAADLKNLAAIRQFVEAGGGALALPAKTIDDLVLAVDESATNIIVHGYQGQPGEIEVVMRRESTAVVVQLRDQAPPFDPTRLPDPDVTLPLELRPVGGMGVYLTRKLVDVVRHRLTEQGHNELTLVKHTPPQQPGFEEASYEPDR